MARSRRKKSTAQYVVSMAAMGLPEPVRRIAGTRFVAPLAIVLGTVLVATGVVSVDWSGGRPKIEIDRERAQEVRQKVASRVGSVREYLDESRDGPRLNAILAELAGGRVPESQPALPSAGSAPEAVEPLNSQLPPPPPAPFAPGSSDSIRIASFNIQVFGTSKLAKPDVMRVLADVVRRFDVVAIQEVRSVDDSILPTFVSMINSAGVSYNFLIGPRLGRTSSKEQYAILFNAARIEVDGRSIYTVPDPQDLLHREPLVARFRVRGVPPERAFTFSLVDIHTDPDETDTELDALADVFVGVQRNGSGEDDVILLGDLNVDEYHFGRLGDLPNITHAVTGVMTNTRQTRMYDNLIFDRTSTVEYTGRWGVLNLMTEYGLSEEQALQVSDHMPVWAEFSIYEGGRAGPLANLPGGLPRY
ncbi:MAG: endonuclease/exonuclease/phosphatase family protein [Planctomycetes bacterium]|nr:endonuclease/exonuclease/phosphatase family protein [Planctomycetota bacterium]